MMGDAWAVIPAGGKGNRFSSKENKLLADLKGKPVLIWTLDALLHAHKIKGIVIAAHEAYLAAYQELVADYMVPPKPIQWVRGGSTRRASVYEGLKALPKEASIVAVHDAARPLIDAAIIDQAITQVEEGVAGVVVSVPIRDTVKKVSNRRTIMQTIDREPLWRAQTPQVFDKKLLMKAHEIVARDEEITDDAQLMERAQLGAIEVLEGQERNLKITTYEDLLIAEGLLRSPIHI